MLLKFKRAHCSHLSSSAHGFPNNDTMKSLHCHSVLPSGKDGVNDVTSTCWRSCINKNMYTYIYIYLYNYRVQMHVYINEQRKFRSQTCDNMERGRQRRGAHERRIEERKRRNQIQVRQMLGKPHNIVFFQ